MCRNAFGLRFVSGCWNPFASSDKEIHPGTPLLSTVGFRGVNAARFDTVGKFEAILFSDRFGSGYLRFALSFSKNPRLVRCRLNPPPVSSHFSASVIAHTITVDGYPNRTGSVRLQTSTPFIMSSAAMSKKNKGKKVTDPNETSKLLAAKISQLEQDAAGEKDQEAEIGG